MWVFVQNSGNVLRDFGDGKYSIQGHAYAGKGTGKNNPDFQTVKDVGPLPCGFYLIGEPIDHPHLGLFAMPLLPDPSNVMYDRGDFWWHGENAKHPGESSNGCVVSSPLLRHAVHDSKDNLLRVIKELI
jgi:hypothetical protein